MRPAVTCCARCGVEGVELGLSWATLEPICRRCDQGLPPLRPGDVGAGLTHPYGRVYFIAPPQWWWPVREAKAI
jgi:hypothetical protein